MRSRFAILSILLVSILSCGQPAATPRHDFSALSFRPLGPGVDGTRIVIEPSRGVTPLIRLIDRAQKQIFVEAYILTHRRIIRALQRAEAQGVGVYVLLDRQPFGMGPQPQQLASTLSAAGVAVRWASPRFTYSHAKFLVIDDRTAVIATANLSKAAYNSNREVLVIDQSPEDVRALSSLFRQDWDRLTGLNRDPNIVLSPRSSRDILSQLVLSARKSIDVYAEEVADSGMEHT
ncbi:MAG TPA: phospholipase D-like domain-containing protein, partial [Chloroflexota bacterium]